MSDLVQRLQKMRGPYLGDGVNRGVTTSEILDELDRLTRELEVARKDAGRHDWMMRKVHGDGMQQLDAEIALRQLNREASEAYIDAAMSQEK